MKLRRAAVVASLACLLSATCAYAQTKRALLIGIDTYEPAGTSATHPPGCTYGRCELGYFENLEGAVNDSQSMADLLTSPKFGFPANQVVLLTNPNPLRPAPGLLLLPAEQTTRDGILAAMQKYLVDLPQPGDTVVFYAASHGSLRVNSKGTKLTVLVNGQYVHADSTLVPSDAWKGGYDVRDREMTRIFNAALDKGIHLTIIFDNCHSGGVTRGIAAKYRERDLPFDPRDIAEPPLLLPDGDPLPGPTLRKDNPALVFSAVQQDQSSKEMPDTVPPTESHGAFTAALVQALQVLPADAPAAVVFQRVRAVLGNEDVPDEDPDLDATAQRRGQPLFGGASANSASAIRSAVIAASKTGSVWLDVGRASGIGVGSEFTSANTGGQKIQLRVTALDGIARAQATVVSPSAAACEGRRHLRTVEMDPRAIRTPCSSGTGPPPCFWRTSSPPPHRSGRPESQPSPILPKSPGPISSPGMAPTGPSGKPAPPPLSRSAHNSRPMPSNKKFPPAQSYGSTCRRPASSLRSFCPHLQGAPSQTSPDLAGAHYALTGTLTPNGPAWAWFHKSELAAGPPSPNAPPHSPGCSPTGQYPVRSDWVAPSDTGAIAPTVAALNRYASLLAKVHGWLQLANSPADASHAAYYSLALTPSAGGAPLTDDALTRQGEVVRMGLQAPIQVSDKRWVYVLDIDCHGKGTLLYPAGNSDNQFPNDSDTGNQFLLPSAPLLRVGPPFGVDTFILLSTAQPLSDPYILNFEGVAKTRGAQSPLEQLLGDTSSATRGSPGQIPTNWSIGLTTMRSIPQ